MFRLGLSIVLAVVFALQTSAADKSENDKAAIASAVSTAKLDGPSDIVLVKVCVAELLCPAQDGKTRMAANDSPGKAKAPSMEADGAAWLAWAKNQGRLRVRAEPTFVTQDNRPVCLEMGNNVPTSSPEAKETSARQATSEQTFVGLSVSLTPRVLPKGSVVLDLDIQNTSLAKRDGATSPIIEKYITRTSLAAKDGRTTVLPGLITRAEGGSRQAIIAVTPQINPKR